MSGLEPAMVLAIAGAASTAVGTGVAVQQARQQSKAARSLRNAGQDQQRQNLRRTRTAFASMANRPTSTAEPFRKQVTGDAPSGS